MVSAHEGLVLLLAIIAAVRRCHGARVGVCSVEGEWVMSYVTKMERDRTCNAGKGGIR